MRARPLALLAMLLGCDSTNVDPPSLVNTLRVLAVQADKPFAEPGETVQLEALVADPLGKGRAVDFAWGTCVNPGSAEIPDCVAAIGSYATGGSSFTVTVPTDALDNVPPSLPIGSVGVVFAACAGQIVMQATATSPVTCLDGNGQVVDRTGFMWGEKRITVVPVGTPAGYKNKNPTLASQGIFVDGKLWDEGIEMSLEACDAQTVADCPATGQHTIEMDITPDSIETYFVPTIGNQTEDVVGFFFASQGEWKDDFLRPDSTAAMVTVLALDKPDRTRPVDLWFVVRDDRGGITFTQRRAFLR